ncbi:hypothetical protein TIFTF001_011270 [Ficus carica]|uniref:Uncharacterized protein n=1 Tax=Ficus carica TaxID=3494 RepID=A0AA88DHU9_FICCA|nr:hypothetical protein TIFTF001_011270 [Ficus carica]
MPMMTTMTIVVACCSSKVAGSASFFLQQQERLPLRNLVSLSPSRATQRFRPSVAIPTSPVSVRDCDR